LRPGDGGKCRYGQVAVGVEGEIATKLLHPFRLSLKDELLRQKSIRSSDFSPVY
jgi:hypothetical protein